MNKGLINSIDIAFITYRSKPTEVWFIWSVSTVNCSQILLTKIFWNLKQKEERNIMSHESKASKGDACTSWSIRSIPNFRHTQRGNFKIWTKTPCVTAKFPVFFLSGKSKSQIPCFTHLMGDNRSFTRSRRRIASELWRSINGYLWIPLVSTRNYSFIEVFHLLWVTNSPGNRWFKV